MTQDILGSVAVRGMRRLVTTNISDIIEDSEPEREEERRRSKELKRRKKGRERGDVSVTIEVTDSDATTEIASPAKPSHVAESNTRTVAKLLPSTLTWTSSGESDSFNESFNLPAAQKITCHRAGDDAAMQEASDDDDVDVQTLGLRRKVSAFAFVSRTPSQVSPPSVVAPKKAETSRRRKHSGQRPSLYWTFSEDQMKQVMKCVSCERKWTTRKTVVHKVTHIKSCAKKSLLTDETLTILLSREIAGSLPGPSVVSKSKMKAPMQDKDTNTGDVQSGSTFLNDVVKMAEPAQPRKRRKDKDPASLLLPASDTRTDIRQRAYMLLHHNSADIQAKVPDCDMAPPTTQAISRSKLATYLPSLSRSKSLEGGSDPPPATQAFTGSRLGSKLRGQALITDDLDCVSPLSDADVTYEKEKPYDTFLHNIRHGINDIDDGILHFDPEPGSYKNCKIPIKDNHTTGKAKTLQLIQEIHIKSHSNITPATPSRKADIRDNEKTLKATPQRKRKGKDCEEELLTPSKGPKMTDEEFSDGMKNLIEADQPLYLRILRYEPIHFNVFFELATKTDMRTTGLRVKVKAFLDKQAIHYYGSEPGGGRNRR